VPDILHAGTDSGTDNLPQGDEEGIGTQSSPPEGSGGKFGDAWISASLAHMWVTSDSLQWGDY